MPISTDNPDLFRAILAIDAYNRGYDAGLGDIETGLPGNMIGLAEMRRVMLGLDPSLPETRAFRS